MIIACGIDPAARYGIAIIEYPGDKVLGRYSGRDIVKGRHLLQDWPPAPIAVLAIEDQFLSDNRARQVAAIKVAHRAGEWAGMARVYGWPEPMYVKPQTWRAVYKPTRRVKGPKRWAKSDAIRLANTLFRLSLAPAEHDLAEALLIARWAAVRAVSEMRTKG